MIRVFLVFFLASILVFAKNDIDKDIKDTSGQIKYFSKSYSSTNKKMAKMQKLY